MDKKLKLAVEELLINDESMTDDEMLAHFIEAMGIPKDIAKKCIAQRGKALGDPDFRVKLNL